MKKEEDRKNITPQREDFSRWYLDVIQKADLMDYAPVRGCIVFKPDGYALWEGIQRILDERFKETGHRNAYFPMFIPESFFEKEKEHVEGFNPELPWVTHAGGEALEERLAIRPTSETMIGHMFAKWIHSYRELPLLINQWANVVRWEKRTLPFLRTTEFLWQEGHTAHEDEADARRETLQMLELYREFVEDVLAMPVIVGQKTDSEKFAGACETFSIEALMQDGRAVQAGTSHYMGTNFAQAFHIMYTDRHNSQQFVHTTSWGVSTRLIGAMIMVHGDDRGVVLPPKIAPTQLMLIPIGPPHSREAVMPVAESIRLALKQEGIRVGMDDRTDVTPGWKYNEYEMRGVPVRLEIGLRDIQNKQAILVSRVSGEKRAVALDDIVSQVQKMLQDVHVAMYHRALSFRQQHTCYVDTLDEIEQEEKTFGFIEGGWCGESVCEQTVKQRTGMTSRNIPFSPSSQPKTCLVCTKPAKHTVIFARAY